MSRNRTCLSSILLLTERALPTVTGADNSPDNAFIGQVLLRHSEDTEIQVRAAANFKPRVNHFVEMKIRHNLTDSLIVDAGIDLFTGDPDTFWGRWDNNDRLFLTIKLLF